MTGFNPLARIRFLRFPLFWVSLIGILALIRLINLDSDPGAFKALGDAIDEGYWASGARNVALYNHLIIGEETLGATSAPFYTLLCFGTFKLFGVSTYTLRLTGAIFGILTILLAYYFLKRYDKKIALLGALFLALNYYFFTINRMAYVENVQSFFILLTFYLLERKSYLLGGLSCGLIIAIKFTGFLILPAFLIYFIFKAVRKDFKWFNPLKFILGGAIIGSLLLVYEYSIGLNTTSTHIFNSRFVDMFSWEAFATLFSYRNTWFVNPINVFLAVCFLIYLWHVGKRIFKGNISNNIKRLDNLDIVIISWFFGYMLIQCVLQYETIERYMHNITVLFSFIPAILIVRKIDLKSLGENKLKGILIFDIFILILFLMSSLMFTHYLAWMFAWNRMQIFFLSFLATMAYYLIYTFLLKRNLRYIYVFSLGLMIFALFTPRFTIRDASLELGKIIYDGTYVIGCGGHLLSYNSTYHPLWWWPRPSDNINVEFIKTHKPGYVLSVTEERGKRQEWGGPLKYGIMETYLGIKGIEKVYSFPLYPIWGKYSMKYNLYKIDYEGRPGKSP